MTLNIPGLHRRAKTKHGDSGSYDITNAEVVELCELLAEATVALYEEMWFCEEGCNHTQCATFRKLRQAGLGEG